MLSERIEMLLERALSVRSSLFDDVHQTAFRLFNGFLESPMDDPAHAIVVDLYARTLVLFNYGEPPHQADEVIKEFQSYLLERFPWIQAVVLKARAAPDENSRRGKIVYGEELNRKIREGGVWYAVDLTLNMDASLYLDTRNLRLWLKEHLSGKRVLNTFAYTGSLGVAALAGGARQVMQMDLNRRFLNLAKDSYTLNGFPINKADFRTGDFWPLVNQLKRSGELFDCILVDPPFFSVTERGRVDLVANSQRVINKVRPLIAHNGYLVAINNALFLSGLEYQQMLEELCADGYLTVETVIPVPPDITGYPETQVSWPPTDPAPFNHSTKIAVLRVKRKDEQPAT